uniref:Tubulin-folding cofactor D C-terminal domain-containing protein n=1 Tax=Hucho hucho TaxID=62062 RepID=A0A4W5L564_9TELE
MLTTHYDVYLSDVLNPPHTSSFPPSLHLFPSLSPSLSPSLPLSLPPSLSLRLQVRFSSQSLFDHLMLIQQDTVALGQFSDALLRVFRDNLRNDRVSIPFLKMLDQMLARACFDTFTTDQE